MIIWTLATKDLRLLLRDVRAAGILLAMPFVFILVLGLAVGEGFGRKPDDRMRVSVVNQDKGYFQPAAFREGMAWLALMPGPAAGADVLGALAFREACRAEDRDTILRQAAAGLTVTPGLDRAASALALWEFNRATREPREPWAQVVLRDLEHTGGIRVEIIDSLEEARALVDKRERPAVLVLGPQFSERMAQCSFLADGINPMWRDGVDLGKLDAQLLYREPKSAAASIMEQVAQVTLLRVILPWMIGRAFEKLGEREFLSMLGERVHIPVPVLGKPSLNQLLTTEEQRKALGTGVKRSLQELFPNYNLTGQTWASLTRSDPNTGPGAGSAAYRREGSGPLNRGAYRYQVLVPAYTVMFAFFLVLIFGWLFVSERRQGTLKRLQAAPVMRSQILIGKLLPCFGLSLIQSLVLLGAGRLVFGMSWGAEPLWLLPVVFTTSLAAMGMALFVATLARTEMQVAIYGTPLVLLLALVSGCVMPRDLMPDEMKELSRLTPHAWALDAYSELLTSPHPSFALVMTASAVLAAFGVGFIVLAWWFLKLD